MRKSILACLLLLVPLAAFAKDQCEYSRPLDMQLDLTGVSTVVFKVGSQTGCQTRRQGRTARKGLCLQQGTFGGVVSDSEEKRRSPDRVDGP